jgi:MFS family permease
VCLRRHLLGFFECFVFGTVDDPYNTTVMMTATFLLGIGEISAVIAVLGQEAPPQIRGAWAGVFGLVGTAGILTATFVGGQAFDRIGYGAPFTGRPPLAVRKCRRYNWLHFRVRPPTLPV